MASIPPVLPTELFELIVSFVEHHATYAAICLTSKLGRDIATSPLYHTIGNDFGNKHEKSLQLMRQLSSLVTNPQLAGHVKAMHVRLPPHSDTVDANFSQHALDILSLMEKPSQSCLGFHSEYQLQLRQPTLVQHRQSLPAEFYLQLVLSFCPNVERIFLHGHLHLLSEWSQPSHTLATIYRLSHQRPSLALEAAKKTGFCSIREIELRHRSSSRSETGAEEIEFLLWFPSLERLRIDTLHATISWGSGAMASHMRSMSLRELIITSFRGNNDELEFLVESCPMLTSLSIKWTWKGDHNWTRINWARLGHFLGSRLHQLQRLTLDYNSAVVEDDSETESDEEDSTIDANHDYNFEFWQFAPSIQTVFVPADALRKATHINQAFAPSSASSWPSELTIRTDANNLGDAEKIFFCLPNAHRIRNLIVVNRTQDQSISMRDGKETHHNTSFADGFHVRDSPHARAPLSDAEQQTVMERAVERQRWLYDSNWSPSS